MIKSCAVLQSNYLPWRGYFDLINDVDLFVFYDEVQYTTFDWRNRNKIYTKDGVQWITLPCGRDRKRTIAEVKISSDVDWQKKHFDLISEAYKKAPFFTKFKPFLEHIYLEQKWIYLSEFNQYMIKYISQDILGIDTAFARSKDFISTGQKGDKMLSLVLNIGAKNYLSGPSAKDYLNEYDFNTNGINVIWKDYSGYPEYKQTQEPFEGSLSIIDLLFNTGDDAAYYIWGWRSN